MKNIELNKFDANQRRLLQFGVIFADLHQIYLIQYFSYFYFIYVDGLTGRQLLPSLICIS